MARIERLSFRHSPRVGDVLTFLPRPASHYSYADLFVIFIAGALIGGVLAALGVIHMVERIQAYAPF